MGKLEKEIQELTELKKMLDTSKSDAAPSLTKGVCLIRQCEVCVTACDAQCTTRCDTNHYIDGR